MLSALNRQGQFLSPNPSVTYAPAQMAKRPEAGGRKKRPLEMAMHRLLAAGTVKIVKEGPPSRSRSRLWVTAEDFSA